MIVVTAACAFLKNVSSFASSATQVCLHESKKGICIYNLTWPTRVKQVLKPSGRNTLVLVRKVPQEPFLPLQ